MQPIKKVKMAEVLDLNYDHVEALNPTYYKGSYVWQDGGAKTKLLKSFKQRKY